VNELSEQEFDLMQHDAGLCDPLWCPFCPDPNDRPHKRPKQSHRPKKKKREAACFSNFHRRRLKKI